MVNRPSNWGRSLKQMGIPSISFVEDQDTGDQDPAEPYLVTVVPVFERPPLREFRDRNLDRFRR